MSERAPSPPRDAPEAVLPLPAAARNGARAEGTLPIRAAVVGLSVSATCGMRAHASILAGELLNHGVSCSDHWLMRAEDSLAGGRSEIERWTRALTRELASERPDVILLHYSVFAYSHRGFPVHVPRVVAALRRSGIPVLAFMHEIAFPRGLGGARGRAWALTHRLVLPGLMRACSAAVVTTDFRGQWLGTRRWLPRRPIGLAPVFSNLPPPAARSAGGGPVALGLFGYFCDGDRISLVLDAVARLLERGNELELRLLGAPGRDSALAESWLAAADARGLAALLKFEGPLPAQELSDALAACELLLFADAPGPTSRKGTLAGSLASGRPVIALDGHRTWPALIEHEAADIVAPTAESLARAVAELLADDAAREALGARGCGFAERHMGVELSARVVAEMLASVLGHSDLADRSTGPLHPRNHLGAL